MGCAHQHHLLHAGQGLAQGLNHGGTVQRSASVKHAIGGNQHLGCDLFEPVKHGRRAHVGGAHAPHRAQAGAGQKGHHGFRHVGQVSGHAVATLHTQLAQGDGQRGHLAAQLGPRQLAHLALLVLADDGQQPRRVRRRAVAQHLVGVVHLRAGEPLVVGHGSALQHGGVRGG